MQSTRAASPVADDTLSRPDGADLKVLTASRRSPNVRALVGGLLVTLGALGAFAVATDAVSSDVRSVVVVRRDVPAGTRLGSGDLETIRVKADPRAVAAAITSADRAAGTTTLGPLRRGELLQAGSLVRQDGPALPEVSFSIPAARALGGDLRSGETVDVLATDRNGDGQARTAVAGARVLRVNGAGGSSFARGGDLTITVSVRDRVQGAALVAAADQGNITLMRTTGAEPVPTVGAPLPPLGPAPASAPASSSDRRTGGT